MPVRHLLPILVGTTLVIAPRAAGAQERDPVEFVLEAAATHPVVFLGDVHPLAEPKRILAQVIARQDPATSIDWLALEVASEEQETIDRYLASSPEDTTLLLERPRTLRAHWGASREYLAVYRAVWHWNHGHAERPIRILAADLRGWPIAPLTENMAAGGFANRDEWMARRFLAFLRERPGARVLVFMGGYHGLGIGGGEVTVGRSTARFDRWFSGWLRDGGVRVFSILTDARQGDGHGATRVFDALAMRATGRNYALTLTSETDSVARPLHEVELEGYRLGFWPDRFALREAVDAMIVLDRATPTTPVSAP
jgi:hypothetical protein